MTPSISVKPEPPKAQSNWSYHAYFLKQRQQQKIEVAPNSMQTTNSSEPSADMEHRQRVIAKMEALAASIDVHLSIKSPDSVAPISASVMPTSL